MGSPFYSYFEIRSSAAYAVTKDTAAARQLLDELPELRRTGQLTYAQAEGYPWVQLTLVNSSDGNYAFDASTWHDAFTLMAIVCSKSEAGQAPARQLAFFKQLAHLVQWELIEECNDEDEESVVLYQPEQKAQ